MAIWVELVAPAALFAALIWHIATLRPGPNRLLHHQSEKRPAAEGGRRTGSRRRRRSERD